MYNIFYLFCLLFTIKEVPVLGIGNDYFSSPANLFRLPVTFYKGTIGVNFLGFHASAGLFGGLLADNGSPGGPHAEASTPYGQSAGAGLGIRIQNGSRIAYLYAEAQLGTEVVGVCLLNGKINNKNVKWALLKWDQCAALLHISN